MHRPGISCIHLALPTFGAYLTVLFMQIRADLVDESMLMIESLQQAVYAQSVKKTRKYAVQHWRKSERESVRESSGGFINFV